MKNILALLKIEFILTKRNLSTFIMGIGFPIAIFLLFSGMNDFDSLEIKERATREMLISMTLYSSLSFAFYLLPMSISDDRNKNWLSALNSSPVTLSQYYLVKFIRVILNFIISVVVMFLVGHFVKGVNMSYKEWIVSGVLLVLCSICFMGIGLLLSLVTSQEKLGMLSNIVYLLLAMIGGLWWPSSLFPKWLQNISELTPTYHALNVVNKYLKEEIFATNSMLILLGYAIIFIIITVILKKRIEEK